MLQNKLHFFVACFTKAFISLVRRIWRLTIVQETIVRRSIRLEGSDRTSWTIQTHSDELNWAKRRT